MLPSQNALKILTKRKEKSLRMIPLKGPLRFFGDLPGSGTIIFSGVRAGSTLPGVSILNELIIYFFAPDSRPDQKSY